MVLEPSVSMTKSGFLKIPIATLALVDTSVTRVTHRESRFKLKNNAA